MAGPGRPGRRLLLTRKLVERICRAIQGGDFPSVAAQEQGVSRRTFYAWMARGERVAELLGVEWEDLAAPAEDEPSAEVDDLFLHLLCSVRAAQAKARGRAERWVFKHKPDVWLLKGPGRQRGDEEGWTSAVRDLPPPAVAATDALLLEALRSLGLEAPRVVPSTAIAAPSASSAALDGAAEGGVADA